jgi:peptidyl-prolyl cis-trans isomerase B (cyclophilin B)
MKRVFSSRSKALVVPFSFALALTLTMGLPITSHADVKSLWNPMHWLNSDQVTDSAATDARKKADQAQQAADQAMQDAQKALEKAAEARHQAEALEKTPHGTKKPVVVAPTEETQTSTETAQPSSSTGNESEKPAQTVYKAPANSEPNGINQAFTSATPKKEAWNPLNWFHKDPDKATGLEDGLPLETPVQAVSAPQPEATQKTESPAETSTDKTPETTTAKPASHGSWNLKNLFTKPNRPENVETTPTHNTVDASTKPEPQAETKPEPQAEPQTEAPVEATAPKTEAPAEIATVKTETKADKADETSSANVASKGGWNLLNLLSKPSIPTNSQGIIQQTKASTDKAPQPAENDQSIKTKAALIETERGNIAIELYPDQAPATVANFVKLINEGFYNRFNMKFHRVVPGFVVQTGDPTGTGAGGSKERIPLEAKNKLSHNTKGIVAMARGADPNSATSQFYITLAPQVSLDGKYAVFGRVISGIDVVSKIEKDDMLYGIRLVDLSTVVRDVQPEKKKFFSSLF